MTQRDTPDTIKYYQTHETTSALGFNPDGMCQKVCRFARNIGPGFASAIAQQIATPAEYRVHDIAKITRGMVVYFDDPNDSNPFGHIAGVVGRRKDGNRGDLSNLLLRTNSVVSGRVVVVDGSYFGRNWGDQYQFAGEWINGVPLDLPERQKREPQPPKIGRIAVTRLEHMIAVYDEMIANHENSPRVKKALRRDKQEIRETLAKMGRK